MRFLPVMVIAEPAGLPGLDAAPAPAPAPCPRDKVMRGRRDWLTNVA